MNACPGLVATGWWWWQQGGGGGAAAAPSSADRWAHHLCQCRRVKNVKRAEAVPAGEGGGAGWVSGPTVKRPVY